MELTDLKCACCGVLMVTDKEFYYCPNCGWCNQC